MPDTYGTRSLEWYDCAPDYLDGEEVEQDQDERDEERERQRRALLRCIRRQA